MPRFKATLRVKIDTNTASKTALDLKLAELHREMYRIFGPRVEVQISSLGELSDKDESETRKPGPRVKNF